MDERPHEKPDTHMPEGSWRAGGKPPSRLRYRVFLVVVVLHFILWFFGDHLGKYFL